MPANTRLVVSSRIDDPNAVAGSTLDTRPSFFFGHARCGGVLVARLDTDGVEAGQAGRANEIRIGRTNAARLTWRPTPGIFAKAGTVRAWHTRALAVTTRARPCNRDHPGAHRRVWLTVGAKLRFTVARNAQSVQPVAGLLIKAWRRVRGSKAERVASPGADLAIPVVVKFRGSSAEAHSTVCITNEVGRGLSIFQTGLPMFRTGARGVLFDTAVVLTNQPVAESLAVPCTVQGVSQTKVSSVDVSMSVTRASSAPLSLACVSIRALVS